MLLQPRHTIGADEVHVWHLRADGLTEPADLRTLLSAQELARMNCLRHERDRTLFLWARGLVRTVLASYLDCSCHDVRFTANEFGKPILAPGDSPGAKYPPLHFNLTHSRGAVALAVSGGREVGIDVEERRRPVEYLPLAERFFAETEARHLRGLHPDELPAAFFAIWTLKEAYVKGIGRGLTFPLEAFCFDLDGCRLRAFRPLADFVACDWHFLQFDLGERHCGALAVRGAGAIIEMRDWAAAFVMDAH
jgi:4'-phosphopantetheinyl transferase